MKKRWTKVVVLLGMALSLLAGCGATKTQNSNEAVVDKTQENANNSETEVKVEQESVTSAEVDEPIIRIVSTFEGTCQVQTQIAYILGFYEAEGLREGIDYEFVEAGGETGAVLLSTDKADIAIGLISGMLQPLDNGLEAKAILGLHTGCITLVTLGDSDIQSTADLKGKKIGVTALSSSQHIAALRALNYENISPDDVEFIVYDKDSIQQALFNGAVDVIGLGDYKANILVKDEGAKIIFDTSVDERTKDENCCVLFASRTSIERSPQTLAKLCTAIQKASVWIEQNPDLAAQIQAAQGYTVGDVEVNTALLKTYTFPTSLSSLKEAIYRNFDDAKTLGLLKEETDKDVLAESSYVFLEGVEEDVPHDPIESPFEPEQFLTVKE